jgi:tRNA threonylcarbamoyladenosine biosynthesis protein TsaE
VIPITPVFTNNAEETEEIGRQLGKWVTSGDVIALYGELGTGKTVLVRGLASSLGVRGRVESPSFTIVCEHEGRIPLYHMDLFRLSSVEEILKIGYEEYLYGDGVCAIEWAEKMGPLLPRRRLDVRLRHIGENRRRIEVTPYHIRIPPLSGNAPE